MLLEKWSRELILATNMIIKKSLIIITIAFLLFTDNAANISANATPPPVPIVMTGQTFCYNETGDNTIIDCSGTGQDGDSLAGIAWPSPRFTVNDDLTITDKLTKLIWSMNSNPVGKFETWQQSLDYINTLNRQSFLGYNDWRMPNVNELESIVNKQPDLATWLSKQGFTNTQIDYYWTSTTYASYSRYAWSVSMYGGIVAGRNKSDLGYLWPVRGGPLSNPALAKTGQTICFNESGTPIPCLGTGQDGELQTGIPWPSPRFADNGDQTITDRLTGLMWSKDGQAPGPSPCNPGTRMTHQEALDYINCLNVHRFLNKNDWRLPNRNELTSLINRGQTNSASWLNTNGFRDIDSSSYWSSTSYPYATWNAWNVNLHDGAVVPIAKKIKVNVWPVCSGP